MWLVVVFVVETEFGKAFLYFRGAHEKLPQKAAAVILYHHCLRALVYGQIMIDDLGLCTKVYGPKLSGMS